MTSTAIFTALILTTPALLAIEPLARGELFRCDFEAESDRNFDRWPDHWKRRQGPGFPLYVQVAIQGPDPACPSGRHCLRIQLDGGAAVAYSPRIKIEPHSSYLLRGYLKTQPLQTCQAFYSVTYYDAKDTPLRTQVSRRYRRADSWTPVEVGPLAPAEKHAEYVILAVHLEPSKAAAADSQPADLRFNDLHAAAWFDDVRWLRAPHLKVATQDAHNFVSPDEPLILQCRFSGVDRRQATFDFELRDHRGETVDRAAFDLNDPFHLKDSPKSHGGKIVWKPATLRWGFYQVVATLKEPMLGVLQDTATLVVYPRERMPDRGEFGWSLRGGDVPMSLRSLGQVLTRVNINWVELPAAIDEQPADASERRGLLEHLSGRGVEVLGAATWNPSLANGWETIQPLARGNSSLQQRANHLVKQMVELKRGGASIILAPDPFGDTCHLVNPNGSPGELLMPWLVTSSALSGATWNGTCQFARQSQSHVFARGDSTVTILWSENPVTERFQVAGDVQLFDAWGNEVPFAGGDGLADGPREIEISVSDHPIFIVSPLPRRRESSRQDLPND